MVWTQSEIEAREWRENLEIEAREWQENLEIAWTQPEVEAWEWLENSGIVRASLEIEAWKRWEDVGNHRHNQKCYGPSKVVRLWATTNDSVTKTRQYWAIREK